MAAGFQQTFPVCEVIREPLWQLQGAGAMPAPYCFPPAISRLEMMMRKLGSSDEVVGAGKARTGG